MTEGGRDGESRLTRISTVLGILTAALAILAFFGISSLSDIFSSSAEDSSSTSGDRQPAATPTYQPPSSTETRRSEEAQTETRSPSLPSRSVRPDPVLVGQEFTLYGNGFMPGIELNFTVSGRRGSPSVVTDGEGSFEFTFDALTANECRGGGADLLVIGIFDSEGRQITVAIARICA
jgi:hypothetical protein